MDRAESQIELNNLVDVCFEKKAKIDFEEFKRVAEKVTSEMFFCIFSLIKTHLPSIAMLKKYEQGLKKSSETLLLSPSLGKKMAPAKILSKFSQLSSLVQFSTPRVETRTLRVQKSEEGEVVEENKKTAAQVPYFNKVAGKPKSSFAPNSAVAASPGVTAQAVRLPNAKLKAQEVINSPSTFLQGQATEKLLFCECGKEISDFNLLLCADCVNKLNQPKCEGYLTKKAKTEIKKYWMCIEKRELFCILHMLN